MSDQNYITYPILHNVTLDQDYFQFPIDPLLPQDQIGNTYSLYINYTNTNCPTGYFIWDYFSSGELYVNTAENQSIKNAKSTFVTLFKNFLSKPNKLGNILPIGSQPFEFVTSVNSPTSHEQNNDALCAWMFKIEKFFEVEKADVTSAAPISIPLCSFLTLKDTNRSITIKSDHYSFANLIDDVSICSCPELNTSNSSYVSCTPSVLGLTFKTCPKYSPKKELLKSTALALENTEKSFVLVLEYSLSQHFTHLFDIHAIHTDSDPAHVFSLNYPLTENYDELVPSAIAVYEEFLNNYVNSVQSHPVVNIEENTNLQINSSYISSLLSV